MGNEKGISHGKLLSYIIAALAFIFVTLMTMGTNRPTTDEVRSIVGDKLERIDTHLQSIDKRLDNIEDALDPTGEKDGPP